MTIRTRNPSLKQSENPMMFELTDKQLELFVMLAAHCRLGPNRSHGDAAGNFLDEIENRFGSAYVTTVCDELPLIVEIDPHTPSTQQFTNIDFGIEFVV